MKWLTSPLGVFLWGALFIAFAFIVQKRRPERAKEPGLKEPDDPKWVRVFGLVAWAISLAYLLIDMAIGGDALNGREDAGRYFLGRNGSYTEVSKRLFYYSYFHGSVAEGMIALTIIFIAICRSRRSYWSQLT